MLLKMERSYNDMLYEMQGHASLDSLLALVDSLGAVPGRKAVIYFCEGLTIPASLEARFRAIIHTANRSNVTVYTVDAAGLRVHSDQATTAQAVQEYGAMGVGDIERRGKYLDALEDNGRLADQGSRGVAGHPRQSDRRVADQQHQRPGKWHRPD